jgi:hypothetical protein
LITPIVLYIIAKVEKGSQSMILKGQLATEQLKASNIARKIREARKAEPNKVIQKYGEIYGYQARKQIAEDEEEERRVVNMHEKRLQKPWKDKYKRLVKKIPEIWKDGWQERLLDKFLWDSNRGLIISDIIIIDI